MITWGEMNVELFSKKMLKSKHMFFKNEKNINSDLGLKTKVFCRKQSNTQNQGQGTHSAKMGAVAQLKIPQMPPKFSAQFFCPSPKVKNFQKKISGCP